MKDSHIDDHNIRNINREIKTVITPIAPIYITTTIPVKSTIMYNKSTLLILIINITLIYVTILVLTMTPPFNIIQATRINLTITITKIIRALLIPGT